MGEKLIKYFKYIHDDKGIGGSIELAKMTKIPSIKAASVPDTKENIDNFRAAIKTLTGKDPPTF